MSKENKKRTYEDDGRTIANMNVEGMPWYKPEAKSDIQPDEENSSGKSTKDAPEQLSREGQRAMTRGVMLASLLIGSIYAVVIGLFILFCVFVWFK